jgi:hypothetical protein
VWIGIGLPSAMAFYEAAFAVVISWYPAARLASSLFLALAGALVDRYGWTGRDRSRRPPRDA